MSQKLATVVIFGVVLILMALTAGQTRSSQAPNLEPTHSALANQSRRFQLYFSPHARADTYLVDTDTGRIWHPVTINNAKDTNLNAPPEVWVYEDRIDSGAEFDAWSTSHTQPNQGQTSGQ